MRLPFSRALLFAALLSLSYSMAIAQNSIPNSDLPEPLWTMLLQLTESLPTQIEAYERTWIEQVILLQSNMSDLQISNDLLMQQNGDLQTSLIASRADLAISEQAQALSEKALQDSIASTTRAQSAAAALEAQLTLWKYGMIGAVAVTVVAVVIAAVK